MAAETDPPPAAPPGDIPADVTRPDVTVVVPHYRDFDRLDRCLAALAGQTFAGRYEIVVADNNSPEGLGRVEAAVAGRARIVVQPDPGAGPARNRGAAAAAAPLLAFTDADCLPHPGWLAAGVAASAPGTLVGGRVEVLTAGARKTPAEALEAVFAFDNEAYVTRKGFSVTANLFVPADVFARVGPFPTGVSEDIEWCWRARDRGIPLVYAAGAVVGHPARRTRAELDAKWTRLAQELFLLEIGRGRSVGWVVARSWLMVLELPLAVVRVVRAPMLAGVGERLGAAGMLIHNRWFRLVATHRIALDYRRRRNASAAPATGAAE